MSAARVAAIKAELGLPESLVGALPIVGAANLAMGMELDESATLPTIVQKLEAALGLQPSIDGGGGDSCSRTRARGARGCVARGSEARTVELEHGAGR